MTGRTARRGGSRSRGPPKNGWSATRPGWHHREMMRNWPLFGLRVTTPRLELRLPSLDDLDALADAESR